MNLVGSFWFSKVGSSFAKEGEVAIKCSSVMGERRRRRLTVAKFKQAVVGRRLAEGAMVQFD